MLSSCAVELPDRLRWLTSGRVLRPFFASAAAVVWVVVLYNATVIDRVPPNVTIRLSPSPVSGNLASTLSTIDIVFNEKVVPDTAKRAFSITPQVAGSFHWQGAMLVFTPSEKLPLSTEFRVHIAAGVTDLSGNAQPNTYDMTFTTVGNPVVTSATPSRDATAVSLDSTVTVTFDRNMYGKSVLGALTLQPAFSYQASWQGQVLTLKPVEPLRPDTVYTIRIGDQAADDDGNPLVAFGWSFHTIPVGLQPLALIPAADSQGISVRTPIAIVFDGPLDPGSVATAITLDPPVDGTAEVMSAPSDNGPAARPTSGESGKGPNMVVFTPSAPLAANTTYTVSLGSGVRTAGGSQAAAARTWSFSTGQPSTNAANHILFLSDSSGVYNVWMMNADGTGQRQITSELSPVVAFDVTISGDKIAYATAGQVKRMNINGDNLQTTASGYREYAPAFTPDGNGLVVARRDSSGKDLGYYFMPLITGIDEHQILADGAPQLGTDQVGETGMPNGLELSGCGIREAFSEDASWMLVAKAEGDDLELVHTGGGSPTEVGLKAASIPVWNSTSQAFFMVASDDGGATWGVWSVRLDGSKMRLGISAQGLFISPQGVMAEIAWDSTGVSHLFLRTAPSTGAQMNQLTSDPAWSERWPTFSPDGSQIVFGRVTPGSPEGPGGIWIIPAIGGPAKQLSTDGICPVFVP